MSDVAAATASPVPDAVVASASKKAVSKKTSSKSSRSKPTRPPTSEMVCNAIKSLKERGGSSLQAIKKYISANYKVDAEKVSPYIRKYLKSAVSSGTLVQTKGKGASGSFKLAAANPPNKAASEPNVEKAVLRTVSRSKTAIKRTKSPKRAASSSATTKKSKSAEKKTRSPKKSTAADKRTATAAAAAKLKKSPTKLKKTSKGSPTKKPKAPKPKKTKPAVAVAKPAKKAAAKKK